MTEPRLEMCVPRGEVALPRVRGEVALRVLRPVLGLEEGRQRRFASREIGKHASALGESQVGKEVQRLFDVAVRDPDDDGIVAALERAGYVPRVREPGHRMLRTPAEDVHVHVWAEEDPEVDRCLRFRDRLRASREDRAAYEELKRELAKRDWEDLNEYANAKGPLIEAILARAAK
jgi:hypothetical protein